MSLLEVHNIHTYYGNIHALKGISVTVNQGEIVTLIGSNGAGKSTTLKTISGLLRPRQGDISFAGKSIAGVPAHSVTGLGLVQVPEGRRVFAQMTVQENLEVGAYLRNDTETVKQDMERIFALFPRLRERRRQVAGTLSGGEQQMLAMGRAMMSQPRLLLLDEPSMGLAPLLVDTIFETIENLNKSGTTILVVEQNARKALQVAHRGYVLQTGTITISGDAKELLADPRVIEAYLGL
ncbi:MAG: ABC transporter ATP-binding protein [Caldilineaceae bacterium]|nr:ABC transporter ATP-binding protein [Caldilineaceae bacterium]